MQLTRPARRPALISIVPMIDVLLILLVFFMVTSTYLDLDLIPAVEGADAPSQTAVDSGGGTAQTVLIRIASDGQVLVAGRTLSSANLSQLLSTRLAASPLTNVTVLPAGRATLQDLVAVMDTATAAGATRLRVVRVEASP